RARGGRGGRVAPCARVDGGRCGRGRSRAAMAWAMSEIVLALRDLTRTFRRRGGTVRAVNGVSIDLVPSEIVRLVGPNGAGKTTLLRLAAGSLAPDAGTVAVMGAPTGSLAARRTPGFAPDGPVFPPALTVRETLDYYARLHAP